MLLEEYKAVLFDLDLTDHDLIEYWGMPFDKMIFSLYREKDTLENMKNNYHSTDERYIKKAHPTTIETINELVKRSYITGVVSAFSRDKVARDLSQAGFSTEAFFIIQGHEDTPVHKPDPKVFEPTLEKLALKGITNLETLYIGDSIRDMQAAIGAGLGFIGITNGLTSVAEFEAEKVQAVTRMIDIFNL